MSISTSKSRAKNISQEHRRAAELKRVALEAGFDVAHVTNLDASSNWHDRLRRWLDAGHHGTMDWMAETAHRRGSPQSLWGDAKSALVVGTNYGPDHNPLANLDKRDRGLVSVYAGGDDYHELMKGRLKQVAQKFVSRVGVDVKIFVDTAPLMERPLAARAGLGWQGKHSSLVSREFGSWLFLGVMLTTATLEPDPPEINHCGSCSACLDICPTEAFTAPYRLDARRCISYLTIEHKGPIPIEFRKPMGNRIYGCDDCLAVCPWNKFAKSANEQRLQARDETRPAPLDELLALDDQSFRQRFRKNPVKRIGVLLFLRNTLIAAGNSDEIALSKPVADALEHEQAIVRGAAVWALGELDPDRAYAARRAQQAKERDPSVKVEWSRIRKSV